MAREVHRVVMDAKDEKHAIPLVRADAEHDDMAASSASTRDVERAKPDDDVVAATDADDLGRSLEFRESGGDGSAVAEAPVHPELADRPIHGGNDIGLGGRRQDDTPGRRTGHTPRRAVRDRRTTAAAIASTCRRSEVPDAKLRNLPASTSADPIATASRSARNLAASSRSRRSIILRPSRSTSLAF